MQSYDTYYILLIQIQSRKVYKIHVNATKTTNTVRFTVTTYISVIIITIREKIKTVRPLPSYTVTTDCKVEIYFRVSE
jgi:hypothetical protein